MISIITSIDEKRGIGKNNDILFRISEDMKRLKAITTGHPLVMGRKTFESLGRLLPNRTHIVITRDNSKIEQLNYKPDKIVSSIKEGIAEAKKSLGSDEIFIFGGGQVFKEAMGTGLIDRLYLTVVGGDFGADVFFPEYSDFSKVIEEIEREAEGYKYKFQTLER
jgi:dihydrofolate reductase